MKRLLSSSLLLFSLVFAAGQTAFAQQAAGDNGDAPAESAAGNERISNNICASIFSLERLRSVRTAGSLGRSTEVGAQKRRTGQRGGGQIGWFGTGGSRCWILTGGITSCT